MDRDNGGVQKKDKKNKKQTHKQHKDQGSDGGGRVKETLCDGDGQD